MYIHMFAFRFKNGVTGEQKNHCVTEIRKLKDEIKEVQESWVGLNTSPRGQGYELGGLDEICRCCGVRAVQRASGSSKTVGLADSTDRADRVDFSL